MLNELELYYYCLMHICHLLYVLVLFLNSENTFQTMCIIQTQCDTYQQQYVVSYYLCL